MNEGITISVVGTPAPQGSKRHVGNGRMVESSAAVQPWREAVKAAAYAALTAHPHLCTVLRSPVEVKVAFYLKRPKGHYGTGRNWHQVKPSAPPRPHGKPDLDKLIRSTLDGLTGIAYVDDAQVVSVTAAKWWQELGGTPGAAITVREVTG